ncbi:MAG: Rid family hydrolase [Dehalococcoidia bacterium]
MEKRVVNPWTWQDQVGFAQGNEVKDGSRVLFVAGQTSVDENGTPINAGNMEAQVGKAFENLEAVLKQAGMSMENVVRLNYYTTDIDAALAAFPKFGGNLPETRPASTLLGVTRLAFPDLLIEIEATAVA